VPLALILWLQGFPDQAMQTADCSVEDARAANHAISLCYALALAACPIALLTGNVDAAERYIGTLLDHSTREGLVSWRAIGCYHRAVLVVQRGDVITGLHLLRSALDEIRATRTALFSLVLHGETAEALGRAGKVAEGLAAIDEAIDSSERTEARWATAESLRIKGELLLLEDAPGAAAMAEDLFRQALDWGRRQGALSWELRAATSLSRLQSDQGNSDDALLRLQSVYGRFTEGFDTTDLKVAKLLLDTFQ
jgi:hypothetical protein